MLESDKALAFAEKAVALAPENELILGTRGRIYLALGRVDAAFLDLDRAINLGIKAPSTYVGRGLCHEATGNKAAAISDYQTAVAMTADDDYARSSQAEAADRLAALLGSGKSAVATTPGDKAQ